jgi:hypothetical protein
VKRKVVPELLDSDAGTADEVRASLADLRWFNRNFGGHTTTLALIRSATRQLGNPKHLTYLDVAGASSDGVDYARQRLRPTTVEAAVLDRSLDHLRSAADMAICGDALALPFRDRSFDLVGCSLFIHHLDPEEIERFAREALRVARHALIINDLIRSPLHYAAALAGVPLYRSRLTRHDAPVSVRRAYTPGEIERILKRVAHARIELSRHYFYRMGVIIWR